MSTRSKKPGESAERETAAGPAGSEGRTREKGFLELFPYMAQYPEIDPAILANPERVEHEDTMKAIEELQQGRERQGAAPSEPEEE
ncbi:MAG TPA: hypothetical protein VFK13_15585 [Gemmatimonadaceae bacterium]|nr:hypothetical protein [Gemmatimonadaceae bacterium]